MRCWADAYRSISTALQQEIAFVFRFIYHQNSLLRLHVSLTLSEMLAKPTAHPVVG